MRALVVSDLHLTDKPVDEYRWRVFDQLGELSNETGANRVIIAGDLTEYKDYHSSLLVNRIVDSLSHLRKGTRIAEVWILRGNHDGINANVPYFKFLQHIPWCSFFVEPQLVEEGKWSYLMLPHTPDPEKDWKDLDLGAASHIFLHGTVVGAASETGHVLTSGIPVSLFKGMRSVVLAGDIHVPQVIGGKVEYIGAPYPIRFGDSFQGRAILIDGKEVTSLPLTNIAKPALHFTPSKKDEGLKKIKAGDQVKLVIGLSESQLGQFHDLKVKLTKEVEAKGAKVGAVKLHKLVTVATKSKKPTLQTKDAPTPLVELQRYCKAKAVPEDVQEVGEELLKE